MKTVEQIIEEKFGEELSGYIYTSHSDLVDFYKEVWNEALDLAAENATPEWVDIHSALSGKVCAVKTIVDKQSILKLKK